MGVWTSTTTLALLWVPRSSLIVTWGPAGYPNSSIATPSSEALAIEILEGRRLLKVDRSASLRRGVKVSKIWHHGFEYRLLKTPQLNKHWRCKHCKGVRLLKKL
jgi:hypothetical protein